MADLFESLRSAHFSGGLPSATIEWSTRMRRSAGLCYPDRRLIRLSTYYIERHPNDLVPILLHEMIHLIHPRHDRRFRDEARRVGALLHARPADPDERVAAWAWLAICPRCASVTPYRTRRRLACARCRDWMGRHPRLIFHRLPGRPSTEAELERAIAGLGDRLGGVPERRRRRVALSPEGLRPRAPSS